MASIAETQASSPSPNINLEIHLHQIDGTYDFSGCVITSRVSSTANTCNESKNSENGEKLPRSNGIQRVDAEAYICNGTLHLSVKVQNISPKYVTDEYQEVFENEIESDEELHTCECRHSSIRKPCVEAPTEIDLQIRAGESIIPSSSIFNEEADVDNEDSETSFTSSDLSKHSEILIHPRTKKPLSY